MSPVVDTVEKIVRGLEKAELEENLDQLKAALEQLKANINATAGAIQDCDYWLTQMPEAQPTAPVEPAKI